MVGCYGVGGLWLLLLLLFDVVVIVIVICVGVVFVVVVSGVGGCSFFLFGWKFVCKWRLLYLVVFLGGCLFVFVWLGG